MRRLLVLVLTALCLAASVSSAEAQRGNRGGRRQRPPQQQPQRPPQQPPQQQPQEQPQQQLIAPPPQTGIDLARQGFAALAVAPHSWSSLVALTLVLPAGSSSDALPGSAWLLGETIRDGLARRLGSWGATALVQVSRSHTVFQVLIPPDRWEGAYTALVEDVFSTPLDTQALQRIRTHQSALFKFESGAPVRLFQSELYGLLAGTGSNWNHDPRGSSESIARITVSELNDLRGRFYRRDQAVVTIVGAVERVGAPAVYGGSGRGGGNRGGAAWGAGRRQRSVREVTNMWIGAAFPARRDSPRTVLEFLLLRLEDELNPVPRDPGLYGATVRLEDLPEGPALVVEAAVLPEDLARWEGRIARALASLEESYRIAAFFDLHKREFRNSALSADAAPEVQGKRMAMDLLREGRPRDLAAEIEAMTAPQVLRAVETLGQLRVLVFGPDLGGSGGRGG